MINPHQDMSRQSTPHYGSVSADHHGRDRIIEAANNESPYPPLPSVTTVISQELAGINRYPSVSTLDLRTAIAVRCGVDADQICVGAGSVDVLANLVNVLVDPGAEVVLPWRSFEAVEFATLSWVDWFNHRRLLEPIGNIPPAEAEEQYYAAADNIDMAA